LGTGKERGGEGSQGSRAPASLTRHPIFRLARPGANRNLSFILPPFRLDGAARTHGADGAEVDLERRGVEKGVRLLRRVRKVARRLLVLRRAVILLEKLERDEAVLRGCVEGEERRGKEGGGGGRRGKEGGGGRREEGLSDSV
jgi:hypothetical protein